MCIIVYIVYIVCVITSIQQRMSEGRGVEFQFESKRIAFAVASDHFFSKMS